MINIGITKVYPIRMCCRIVPRTQSCSPAPIKLLTKEPQVAAKAIAIINGMPETLRMIFAIAKERSESLSKQIHLEFVLMSVSGT